MVPKVNQTKPLYTHDWWQIAQAIKQEHHWTCELCGIQQGEDLRYNITVHHKDHDTFNNDSSNLQVLCQKCHLQIEGHHRCQNHYERRRQALLDAGQHQLPGFA